MNTSAPKSESSDTSGACSRQLPWFCAFLLATLVTGLLLRWQMAGFSTSSWLPALDLRRAHSHLGFYGVLFPVTWIFLQKSWAPRGWLWVFYGMLVALSAVGFLWQGYGFLAIATSTGILAVWLVFAWKIRPRRGLFQRDWLACASLAILASACLIPLVAINTRTHPVLADQLARTFLTLLLFGVFVPSALLKLDGIAPIAWTWITATVIGALYLTQLVTHWLFGLGLIWLALVLTRTVHSVHGSNRLHIHGRNRLLLAWFGFALALAVTGAGLVPYSHFVAIAGIHYLVLGPLLLTFALVRLNLHVPPLLRLIYETSVVAMSVAIVLQDWLSEHILLWQRTAAVAGSIVLVSVVFAITITARTKRISC